MQDKAKCHSPRMNSAGSIQETIRFSNGTTNKTGGNEEQQKDEYVDNPNEIFPV